MVCVVTERGAKQISRWRLMAGIGLTCDLVGIQVVVRRQRAELRSELIGGQIGGGLEVRHILCVWGGSRRGEKGGREDRREGKLGSDIFILRASGGTKVCFMMAQGITGHHENGLNKCEWSHVKRSGENGFRHIPEISFQEFIHNPLRSRADPPTTPFFSAQPA